MIAIQQVRLVPFGLGGAKPVFLRLSEGSIREPSLSSSGMKEVIDGVIQTIAVELEALIVELDAVSPEALRVEPGRALEIPGVGSFPPGEIRLAIQTAARTIFSRIDRITGGALSFYLSAEQASALSALRSRAASIDAAAQAGWSAAPPEHQAGVDQYLSGHLSGPDQAIRSAEEMTVSGEAGSVPVIEPFESQASSKNIAIGVGLVALAGLVLWGILG